LTELQAALPALQVKMDPARISLARGLCRAFDLVPKLYLAKPERAAKRTARLN